MVCVQSSFELAPSQYKSEVKDVQPEWMKRGGNLEGQRVGCWEVDAAGVDLKDRVRQMLGGGQSGSRTEGQGETCWRWTERESN
jgi:hypothetical protein